MTPEYIKLANFHGIGPSPVKSHVPNAAGLFDMHGNVQEWCLDAPAPATARPCVDPVGALDQVNRAYRGGGWVNDASQCRSAARAQSSLDQRRTAGGFRFILKPTGSMGTSKLPPGSPEKGDWEIDRHGAFFDVLVKGVAQRFRWLPPGEFVMGSPLSEPMRGDDEQQHQVTLTSGFWLADTPCTQGFYRALGQHNKSEVVGPNLPTTMVRWDDAWAAAQALWPHIPPGLHPSLPTEAQWEYACRSGTKTAFAFGDSLLVEAPPRMSQSADHAAKILRATEGFDADFDTSAPVRMHATLRVPMPVRIDGEQVCRLRASSPEDQESLARSLVAQALRDALERLSTADAPTLMAAVEGFAAAPKDAPQSRPQDFDRDAFDSERYADAP